MLGSFLGGIATLVESAPIAALYTLIVQRFIHRDLPTWKDILRVMSDCVALVGGVLSSSRSRPGSPTISSTPRCRRQLIEWTQAHIHSKMLFLLCLNVFLLLVGTVMDIFSAIVVVVPLIIPLAEVFGINPVHLGIIFVANLELGFLHPPLGLNLLLASVRFKKPVLEVTWATLPMLGILALGVLLITYVPWLTLGLLHWLGRRLTGGLFVRWLSRSRVLAMKTRTRLLALTSLLVVTFAVGLDGHPRGRASAAPRRPAEHADVPQHRRVSHGRLGHGDRGAGDAGARPPLHDLRRERSGGLWKTDNGGITWDNVTDSIDVAAIGAVAVAPSNPNIVWVGTGDQANARSSLSGKGVFKSTDAGKTWQSMGLPDSHHIARIVIDPTNPDIVYVAAMGHLFSKNEERGVFRTTDGGNDWKKVLYVNDGVGAIDLVINRKTPTTLYAAMYDKDRKPWQIVESGPESGVFKTDDGGEKWTKLGGGLPTGKIGRIGLDMYQKNPLDSVRAARESESCAWRARSTGAWRRSRCRGRGCGWRRWCGPWRRGRRRERDGAARAGHHRQRALPHRRRRKDVDEDVADATSRAARRRTRSIRSRSIRTTTRSSSSTSDNMYITRDGGKTWQHRTSSAARSATSAACGGIRRIEQRIILGSDGGVQLSNDGGKTTDYAPNLRVGEVYAIGVDMDDPYNVYGGLQDHDSWKGPSNGPTRPHHRSRTG